MDKRDITIEQTLHGYSEGHRLLKASIKLPKEIERTMLVMSDMSGSSMVQGFDNYITGYSLRKYYALAKTWYASEMRRPGCVWTHTLLIRKSDFSKIDDLRILIKRFRHPDINDSISLFDSHISVSICNLGESCNSNVSSFMIRDILESLYYYPEKPIYISSNNPQEFEEIVFNIWSQQWPTLRSSFCFCTGSIANRKINNKVFDIQIVPFEVERQLKREVQNSIFIDNNIKQQNYPSWIISASQDLLSKSSFRDLLWKLGEGIQEGRKAFRSIVDIISAIVAIKNEDYQISYLTKLISQLYPSCEDAISMKEAIYVGSFKLDKYLPIANEFELIKELSTTPYYSAFNNEYLNIQERVIKLWNIDKWEAKQLILDLINSELNPLGEELIKGIIARMDFTDIIEFIRERPNLLFLFIRNNPDLLTIKDMWDNYSEQGREILETVKSSKNITETQRKNIVRTLFMEEINSLATDSVKVFKEDAVNSILDIYDNSLSGRLNCVNTEWETALKIYPDLLLSWLKQSNPKILTTAFVATLLNPNSAEVINLGTKLWIPLIQKRKDNDLKDETWLDVMTFMLTLGFHNQDNNSVRLVSYSFEDVHDSIEQNELGFNSWQYLEKHVPSLSWWHNWDKCERLRRALVENFIRFSWPCDEFLRSVQQRETFNKIIDYCHSTYAGRKYLKSIRNRIAHNEVVATNEQRERLLN